MGPCCSCTRAGSRCRQVRAGGATAGEDLAGGLGSLCTLLDEQPEAAETARRGWGLGPWGTCAVECVGGVCAGGGVLNLGVGVNVRGSVLGRVSG